MHSLAILSDMTHVARCSICNVTYANDILVRRKWLFYYYYFVYIRWAFIVSFRKLRQRLDTRTHARAPHLKCSFKDTERLLLLLLVRSLRLQHGINSTRINISLTRRCVLLKCIITTRFLLMNRLLTCAPYCCAPQDTLEYVWMSSCCLRLNFIFRISFCYDRGSCRCCDCFFFFCGSCPIA